MLCNALSCTILLWSEGNISSPIRYLYLPILPETTVSWKYVYGPRHAFVFSGVIITHLSWLFVKTFKQENKMKRIRKKHRPYLIMLKYSLSIQQMERFKGKFSLLFLFNMKHAYFIVKKVFEFPHFAWLFAPTYPHLLYLLFDKQ